MHGKEIQPKLPNSASFPATKEKLDFNYDTAFMKGTATHQPWSSKVNDLVHHRVTR